MMNFQFFCMMITEQLIYHGVIFREFRSVRTINCSLLSFCPNRMRESCFISVPDSHFSKMDDKIITFYDRTMIFNAINEMGLTSILLQLKTNFSFRKFAIFLLH